MNKQRLLSMLAVLVIVCVCFFALGTQAHAETVSSGTCGDNVTWTLDDAGTLTFTGTGDMTNYPFGENVPWGDLDAIRSVIVTDGITSVGEGAFYRCGNLEQVSIGDDVTYIGIVSFYECTSLKSLTLGQSVTNIDIAAFNGCRNLTGVTFPDSLVNIDRSAFDYCSSITEIVIPDKVTNIGESAFRGCSNLSTATIGNNVTSIGTYAFQDCISLTSITVPDSVTSLGNWAFCGCTNLVNADVGDGVTGLGYCAFSDCGNLENITIGNSVTSIGEWAFADCRKLRSLTLPDGLITIKQNAFSLCTGLKCVVIPNTVETIEQSAFYVNTRLWHVLYTGTEEQWVDMSIGRYNTPLYNTTIHYEAKGDEIIAADSTYDTCTHDAVYYCTICEDVYSKQIEGGVHDWTDATCTAPKSCKNCTATEGEALDHSYGDWVTTLEPTTSAPGQKERTCSRCGDLQTDSIDQLTGMQFTDVPDNAYYKEAVYWAAANGITAGKGSTTTFQPNATCTRAEIVTFLWRAAGEPAPESTEMRFTDVPANAYYKDAVLWAVEKGITAGKGSTTTFQPTTTCTRAEIVTFLWRAAGEPAPQSTEMNFTDVPETAYYKTAVLWAVEKGITAGKGSNTTFQPNATCTRAEAVTFLYRSKNP